MPRERNKAIEVTPHQAQYILERLQRAGHLTATHIQRYLADLTEEIVSIERRLRHLRDAHAPAPDSRESGRPGGRAKRSLPRKNLTPRPADDRKRKKRKFTVTAKVLASREIQGRYLPLLNKFTGRNRERFARIARDRGREAAITAMEAALRSGAFRALGPR